MILLIRHGWTWGCASQTSVRRNRGTAAQRGLGESHPIAARTTGHRPAASNGLFAPQGQPQISPGQSDTTRVVERRPGISDPATSQALTGRYNLGWLAVAPFQGLGRTWLSPPRAARPDWRRAALPWAGLWLPFQGEDWASSPMGCGVHTRGSIPLTPALSPTMESSPKAAPIVGERGQTGQTAAHGRMHPALRGASFRSLTNPCSQAHTPPPM